MIRVSAGLYRLSENTFSRKLDDGWFITDAAGTILSGPFASVLDARGTERRRAEQRARRATIRERIVTTPDGADGVRVRVMSPAGHPIAASASVRRIDDYQGYSWHVSTGRGGHSPLCVAAVLAAAHAIDESEAIQ